MQTAAGFPAKGVAVKASTCTMRMLTLIKICGAPPDAYLAALERNDRELSSRRGGGCSYLVAPDPLWWCDPGDER